MARTNPDRGTLACTFCDVTGPTTGAMTAHLRRFLPELLPFTQYRKVRHYPIHPVGIIREYVRHRGKNPWTHRLDSTDETSRTEVLVEFGKLAATAPGKRRVDVWADRNYEAVTRADWEDMLDKAVVAYAARRDTPLMKAHVRRLVLKAIDDSFAAKRRDEAAEDEDDDDVDTEAGERPGDEDNEGIDIHDDDDDDDDDDYEEPPVRQHRLRRRRRRERDIIVDNHATASNSSSGDIQNQEIQGGKVRLDLGIKNVINVPGPRLPQVNRGVSSSIPPVDPTLFDAFPLIHLVVSILGAVVAIPAHFNTTLEDVFDALEKHPGNPIRLHHVKGGLTGKGPWQGVWDDDVWQKVKLDASALPTSLGNMNTTSVEYKVDFVVDHKAVACGE